MSLSITIPDVDAWDTKREVFVQLKGATIVLEHSLISLHLWESRWHKPYISDIPKTDEEAIDYIRCMTITKNVDKDLYYYIPKEEMTRIYEYINDPMTATTFSNNNPNRNARKKEVVTAELLYFAMISYGIPIEFRKWHLNQLITLIRVCEIKNGDPKKMSKADVMARNKSLNAQRRARLHSKG